MVISSYIKSREANIENKVKKTGDIEMGKDEYEDEMQKGTLLLINTRA